LATEVVVQALTCVGSSGEQTHPKGSAEQFIAVPALSLPPSSTSSSPSSGDPPPSSAGSPPASGDSPPPALRGAAAKPPLPCSRMHPAHTAARMTVATREDLKSGLTRGDKQISNSRTPWLR
jgi:hypothetical protein